MTFPRLSSVHPLIQSALDTGYAASEDAILKATARTLVKLLQRKYPTLLEHDTDMRIAARELWALTEPRR